MPNTADHTEHGPTKSAAGELPSASIHDPAAPDAARDQELDPDLAPAVAPSPASSEDPARDASVIIGGTSANADDRSPPWKRRLSELSAPVGAALRMLVGRVKRTADAVAPLARRAVEVARHATQEVRARRSASSAPSSEPGDQPPPHAPVLIDDQTSIRRSVLLRTAVLALVMLWLLLVPARGFLEQTYLLAIVIMLAALGAMQWLCTWSRIYRPSLFAVLLCLDCIFLAVVAGLQNPFAETPQPAAAALRDRGFLFLALPILQAAVTRRWSFTLTAGIAASVTWAGLIVIILQDSLSYTRLDLAGLPAHQVDAAYFDPNFVVIDNGALEVLFLLILGIALSIVLRGLVGRRTDR